MHDSVHLSILLDLEQRCEQSEEEKNLEIPFYDQRLVEDSMSRPQLLDMLFAARHRGKHRKLQGVFLAIQIFDRINMICANRQPNKYALSYQWLLLCFSIASKYWYSAVHLSENERKIICCPSFTGKKRTENELSILSVLDPVVVPTVYDYFEELLPEFTTKKYVFTRLCLLALFMLMDIYCCYIPPSFLAGFCIEKARKWRLLRYRVGTPIHAFTKRIPDTIICDLDGRLTALGNDLMNSENAGKYIGLFRLFSAHVTWMLNMLNKKRTNQPTTSPSVSSISLIKKISID